MRDCLKTIAVFIYSLILLILELWFWGLTQKMPTDKERRSDTNLLINGNKTSEILRNKYQCSVVLFGPDMHPLYNKHHTNLVTAWLWAIIYLHYSILSAIHVSANTFYHSNAVRYREERLNWLCFAWSLSTLKVLNFWQFISYCSSKPLWSGMGEVVPARTSPTLHPLFPPTVHQLSLLAL